MLLAQFLGKYPKMTPVTPSDDPELIENKILISDRITIPQCTAIPQAFGGGLADCGLDFPIPPIPRRLG